MAASGNSEARPSMVKAFPRGERRSSKAACCVRFSTIPTTRASSAWRAPEPNGGGIGPNNFYLEPGRCRFPKNYRGDAAGRSRPRHDRFRDRACLGNVQPRRTRILHREWRAGVSDRRVYRRRPYGDARNTSTRSPTTCVGLCGRLTLVPYLRTDGQRKSMATPRCADGRYLGRGPSNRAPEHGCAEARGRRVWPSSRVSPGSAA